MHYISIISVAQKFLNWSRGHAEKNNNSILMIHMLTDYKSDMSSRAHWKRQSGQVSVEALRVFPATTAIVLRGLNVEMAKKSSGHAYFLSDLRLNYWKIDFSLG